MKSSSSTVLLSVIVLFLLKFASSESEGACYDDETEHRWAVGESYSPIGRCISMNCMSENGVFDALPCAQFDVPSGGVCEVIDEDLTKPYPDCCSTVKCNENNKKESGIAE